MNRPLPTASLPRLVDLQSLESRLDRTAVRERIRDVLVNPPPAVKGVPGELLFDDPRGDCHVKYGYLQGGSHFFVKVATGFYDNEKLGLPVNGGAVLVLSQRTGLVEAILADGGWLTAWRTAAAASLASQSLAPPKVEVIAIIGTGQQAGLQAIWHHDLFPDARVVVAGRNQARTEALAADLRSRGIGASGKTISEAVAGADVIVTATSAGEPLFASDLVRAGAHVTAVGADSPGKQELDPALLARAPIIATDDHDQCRVAGEFGIALRQGLVSSNADTALGECLRSRPRSASMRDAVTVADLTGLTIEDLAIASYFLDRLGLE